MLHLVSHPRSPSTTRAPRRRTIHRSGRPLVRDRAGSHDRCMNELQGSRRSTPDSSLAPGAADRRRRGRAGPRDHRRSLGLSQRAYAASRGLSRAMLARLEAGAGRMSLDTVVSALEGTGFELRVTFDEPPPRGRSAAGPCLDASARQSASARGRSGCRRMPGSRATSWLASVADRGAFRHTGSSNRSPTRRCGGGCTSSSRAHGGAPVVRAGLPPGPAACPKQPPDLSTDVA